MEEALVLDLFRDAMFTIFLISGPMLIVAMVVGLIIAVFQATTQIQEQTLAFVPKIVAIFLTILVLGPWFIQTLVDYTLTVFENINTYIR